MNKKYIAVEMSDSNPYDKRYAIVDSETGEIVDNAQGYGYKSPQKAYAAWNYKNRDKSKDYEKIKLAKDIIAWQKTHGLFKLLDQIAFEIAKGSWGKDDKVNVSLLKELCKDMDDIPYSYRDILWTWRKGERLIAKKKKKR